MEGVGSKVCGNPHGLKIISISTSVHRSYSWWDAGPQVQTPEELRTSRWPHHDAEHQNTSVWSSGPKPARRMSSVASSVKMLIPFLSSSREVGLGGKERTQKDAYTMEMHHEQQNNQEGSWQLFQKNSCFHAGFKPWVMLCHSKLLLLNTTSTIILCCGGRTQLNSKLTFHFHFNTVWDNVLLLKYPSHQKYPSWKMLAKKRQHCERIGTFNGVDSPLCVAFKLSWSLQPNMLPQDKCVCWPCNTFCLTFVNCQLSKSHE